MPDRLRAFFAGQTARLIAGSAALLAVLAGGLLVGLAGRRANPNGRRAESPGEFAIRFMETVTRDHDRQRAIGLLCADGFVYHQPNTEAQINFWSGPEVLVAPHDFKVVQTLQLPADVSPDYPMYKVWVAFRYTYLFEGQEKDISLDDGWEIYVSEIDGLYCASPWAG